MNKIELLPKDIRFNEDLYQLGMWVTAFGKLCIGYNLALNPNKDHLFSVCVEPENEPHAITDPNSGWLNAGIGNARNVDDACDELLAYIKKRKEDFKI